MSSPTSRVPDCLEVMPVGPLRGTARAPGSKSVTNRVVLMAALAEGRSVLRGPLHSDDSVAMRDLVAALGASVDVRPAPASADEPTEWHITGTGGALRTPGAAINCQLSGTTMRFGTAVAALAPAAVTLTGQQPLRQRPIGPLTAALVELGADLTGAGEYPPITIGGGLAGGPVSVDASGSSQFVSALLLAAPYARTDVQITASGSFPAAYVELTAQTMREWGAEVRQSSAMAWTVTAGRVFEPRTVDVEYDASAAAHLFGLAVATGGQVTVRGITDSVQPDARILPVLERFGAVVTSTVAAGGDAVTVAGPAELRAAGSVDLGSMPDQVTTIAALAALADGVTTITGVAVVRGHETDRLAALATELRKVGADVAERPDGLVIDGTAASGGPATLDTHHDHRLAMAFACVAARLPGVRINQPDCVAKTFPDFWDVLRGVGGQWRAA